MATSADDYLGGLRGEAAVDSSGTFSLDLAKSRRTLQRFQLPSADHYILPLVVCAVAGGADSLSFYQQHRHRVVDMGGLTVDLAPGGYLELALLTALRRGGTQASGATWNGSSGSALRVDPGQIRITPLDHPPWDPPLVMTRLIFTPPNPLEKRLLGVARWMAGMGPESDPTAELLKAYSRYSPVPIRLHGRQINLERQGHWKLLAVLNRPPLPLRPLTALRQLELQKDLPFAGYLGLGVGGGGVLLVVDGLLYPLELPHAPEDFRAILWHSGLQRDLSMLKLRENEELQNLRRQLAEICAEINA